MLRKKLTKTNKKGPAMQAQLYLVAGAGLEPTTSGL